MAVVADASARRKEHGFMKDGSAKKVPEETLAHTVPCRQKQARE